ncbi:MAG: efflux RND transporter periplasmic adaptor subunit [Candidatus Omnitrophica bacterium]|nr:efflux RND transporter periplasmic adaptor subunit [Candidatus Omnitrophota bacterium]
MPNRFVCLCLILSAISLAGCEKGTEVKAISPDKRPIEESFTESAKTRLSKTYPITMQVEGRIGRIDLEPGDKVEKGQHLTEFDRVPFEQEVAEAKARVEELKASVEVKKDNRIEETAYNQTTALVQASHESQKAAASQVDAQKARADRAAKELKRTEELSEGGVVADQKYDDVVLEAETSKIELREQEFTLAAVGAFVVVSELFPTLVKQYMERETLEIEVLNHQIAQAEAQLELAKHRLSLAEVASPIDGVVLERMEQGDGNFVAGTELLLLGNLSELEVIGDVLTQDALKLHPGSEVELSPSAGSEKIMGQVKRIEPAGFTKLSSLGVEQQRVNVIVSLGNASEDLGVGYRLRARFITDKKDEALLVPRYSVLQDPDDTHYVFKIEVDHLRKTPVTLGLESDLQLEILSGLEKEDRIVEHPDTTLRDGGEVTIIEE